MELKGSRTESNLKEAFVGEVRVDWEVVVLEVLAEVVYVLGAARREADVLR